MSLALIGYAAAGGAAGASLRYVADLVVVRWWTRPFPLATFGINVVGSLLLGLLVGAGASSASPMFALLGSGVLGGFTTLSTASYQAVALARDGARRTALAYAVGSMVAALVAAMVGLWAGHAW